MKDKFDNLYINVARIIRLGGKGSGNYGHKGRPGQEGGSGSGTGETAVEKRQRASFRNDTPSKSMSERKIANRIDKVAGGKYKLQKAFGGDYLTGWISSNKRKAVEQELVSMGFEKFQDDTVREWVTSYKLDDFRVHIGKDEIRSKKTPSFHITVSKVRPLAHIPYD